MARSLHHRLKALFLTAVFVGSGFALPDLDALLYHSSRGNAPADAPHLDLPGGCGAHSESCALSLVMPVPQTPPSTPVVRSSVAPATEIRVPTVPPRSVTDRLLHPSRAPPAAGS